MTSTLETLNRHISVLEECFYVVAVMNGESAKVPRCDACADAAGWFGGFDGTQEDVSSSERFTVRRVNCHTRVECDRLLIANHRIRLVSLRCLSVFISWPTFTLPSLPLCH